MAESYKLTYFNMKGLAEPIRFIFAYAGVEYEDNRIEREDWPNHKEKQPWGQVPVLQVGDKTLTQSNAIQRYLGKKYGLGGENEWEAAKMDELADALTDLRMEWRKFWTEADEAKKEELKKTFVEVTVPKYFGKFEAIINENGGGPYTVGSKLSWFDLQLAHFLDFFAMLTPGIVDNYPGLKKVRDNVFEVPQIKAWIEKRPVTQM